MALGEGIGMRRSAIEEAHLIRNLRKFLPKRDIDLINLSLWLTSIRFLASVVPYVSSPGPSIRHLEINASQLSFGS